MTITKLNLFQRPNRYWYIRYFEEGRIRWKTTGCTDQSEALAKLTEFKELTKPKPPNQNLSSFTDEYLVFARSSYAKRSVELMQIGLRNLRIIAGDCNLTTISERHVDLYKTTRMVQVAPSTVNVELRTLRTIFNTAIRWKLIEANPFKNVKLIRIPEAAPTFFTKEDLQKLLEMIGAHWIREIILFAALTGLRRGEILNLQWTDLDLTRKTAEIRSSATYKVKAGKRRTIPLSSGAIDVLIRRKALSKSSLVFDRRGFQAREGYVTHKLKEYVRKAGLNPKLHFHSLRHSFGTFLAQDHVSIYEIQKLMGHSDISMTQVYSHLVTSELHDAVNRIRL